MYLEHKDGSQFTASEASLCYATIQCNMLKDGYYDAMKQGYLEGDALKNLKAREKAERGRDFNQRQQNQQSGGGGRPQGGWGQPQVPQQQQAAAQPPMDFDQNIPF
jgi:hypothetical protein